IWWASTYQPAARHPRLFSAERAELREVLAATPAPIRAASWVDLLGRVEVWGLVSAKFLSDAAWYFYLFWLPKYLYDVRGFDVNPVGRLGSRRAVWRMAVEPAPQFGAIVERGAQGGAWGKRGAHADHSARDARAGRSCDRDFQRGVLRTAVLVHARDDRAHR